jgi:prepilin peptidase CpaA
LDSIRLMKINQGIETHVQVSGVPRHRGQCLGCNACVAKKSQMHSLIGLSLLLAMLAVAVYMDVRSHRIPNKLNLIGLCSALLLQAVTGQFPGFISGVLGAAVGLACFAPFYLLRGMGAGDVKLLAAVGAFLGPLGAVYAAMFSLLAGGLGAIGYVVWRALRASVSSFVHEGLSAAGASAFVAARLARRDRLPFAVPIAAGSLSAGGYLTDLTGVTQWLQGTLL